MNLKMNLDPEHTLALARDLHAVAANYPRISPAVPSPRNETTRRVADALDRGLARLAGRGEAMARRLAGLAEDAERFVTAARSSEDHLSRDLEQLI